MSEALQKDPAVNTPPEYNDRLSAFKQCSPKALELRDKVWTKLKS
jgi:spermidine/putrescine transport system substrate-binding protein